MATDLMISGQSKQPLAVQLTMSNPELLDEKRSNWEETLIYWNIKRGVLFSYSPNHPIGKSAISLLERSDSLNDGCYVVDISTNYQHIISSFTYRQPPEDNYESRTGYFEPK
jgi:hypothetical protein